MPVQTQMEAGETTMGTTTEGTTAVSVNHATTLSDAKISASTPYRCASCASSARSGAQLCAADLVRSWCTSASVKTFCQTHADS